LKLSRPVSSTFHATTGGMGVLLCVCGGG
jgi:hypothetical protein